MSDSGVAPVYLVGQGDAADGAMRELVEAGANYAVRRYADGPSWLAAAPDAEPGCVLLDWERPETGGLDTLRRTVADAGSHVAVVLTADDDVARAVAAMQAGAVDLLCHPIASAELARTIDGALDALRRRTERRDRANRAAADAGQLTQRERQVLAGLVEGQSTGEIAGRLGLAFGDVATCRTRLLRLSGPGGLVGLIRFAVDAGLADTPGTRSDPG